MSAYNNVVIAIDFSPANKQVLARGIDIGKQNQANISIIHVVEYVPPLDFGYEPIIAPDWYSNEKDILKQAQQSLQQLVLEHGLNVDQSVVLSGNPKNEIIQYATEKQAGLLVIGSHGRHGIQRILGSTAYPVLHHAPCDVLAVRIRD